MLRNREDLEELEARTLAPYAMLSRMSRGRRFAEPPHPMRTAFQRDRDRIVHSAAFRRLEYKTQVFVNHEGDYYRTRLTHTVEAAQITRTAARALGLNSELAEAVALAHDLGHTPFGHAGERALRALMEPYGGFDHNAQSLRTVDWIEVRYPNFRGLNLTFEVREGIIKHSEFKLRPAAAEFDSSLLPLSGGADRRPRRRNRLPRARRRRRAEGRYADGGRSQRHAALSRGRRRRAPGEPTGRAGRRALPDRDSHDRRDGRPTSSPISARSSSARSIRSVEDVRRAGQALASFGPAMAPMVEELKQLMRERLYRHYRVSRMTGKAGRVLERLFETYMGEPRQMPGHVLRRIEVDGEALARVVADYIAGMTDRFALDEYRKLFDPDERV